MTQMRTPTREKDRMSFSGPTSDAAIIEDNVKLERDRLPYTAKPGSGKVYADNLGIPNTTRPGRANSVGRDARDVGPDTHRKPRTQSNAGNNPYTTTPRPGGAPRGPSPPLNRHSLSNSLNLDTNGSYPSESFSSQPKYTQPLSPSYTTTKYTPSSDTHETDRGKYAESRRYERRSTYDSSRVPAEISIPRDAGRWDRYENQERDRDRERKNEPKSAGPVLHQEFRPSTAEEEFYRNLPPPRGGEYEVGKGGKYYQRY
jgi:hypothetical protein